MRALCVVTIIAITLLMASSQTTAGEETWCLVTVAGDTLCNCPLDSLYETSIVSRQAGVRVLVPLDSVATFFQKGESHTWTGLGVGALAGAGVGALVGAVTYQKSGTGWNLFGRREGAAAAGGILGGLVGAATGLAIGASSGGTEVTVVNLDVKKKIAVVGYLRLGNIRSAQKSSRNESQL